VALIIEDGSGVANANSYADLDFIRAYAASRRVELPEDDDVEGFAIDAMDAIEARKYQGVRSYPGLQPLSFPRIGVVTEEGEYAPDAVPTLLKRAQAQLVVYRAAGIDLFPAGNAEPAIKRDKTGPLETEYFEGGGDPSPSIPLADILLEPLERGQGAFTLSTVRV